MGTVGINFGSATSGAGFDVTTTVASIVSNLKSVETPWNNQLTALKSDDTALTSIGTDLSSLSSSLQSLTNFEGVMAEKEGSSSNPDALTLTSANSTATAGSHTITVGQLAQTSSEYSSAIALTDTLSGNGLTITVGLNGTPQNIPVTSGSSDTLKTYAAAINAAGIGVTASVISDTTGSRLSLVSNTSGAAGQLTITGNLTNTTTNSAVSMKTGLKAQDAALTVDGISVDSSSNTVSTAIPGVTFQLLSTSDTPVTVEITNGNSDIESAVQSFVSAYNTVLGDLKTQEGNTSSGTTEPLYGNPIVSQLQSSLALALTGGAASGSIQSLDQLGITVSNTGALSLNTSTLDSALNSSYSDVVGFFQNSDSFGLALTSTLSSLGNTNPSGAISMALSSDSSQETTLNDNVTAQNTLISTQQTNLTNELNSANETLQAIPQQLSEINELYSAITGYNTGTGQ